MKRKLQLFLCGLIAALSCTGSALAAEAETGIDPGSICLVLLVPLVIAFIVCGIMKSMMKSTGRKTSANTYIAANGINITGRMDRYTHTTETRRRIDNGNSPNMKR